LDRWRGISLTRSPMKRAQKKRRRKKTKNRRKTRRRRRASRKTISSLFRRKHLASKWKYPRLKTVCC